MSQNQFLEKFKSKSDSELERIAMNSMSFVFDARYAAITVLKSRENTSPIIKTDEEEHKKLGTENRVPKEAITNPNLKLKNNILCFYSNPSNEDRTYPEWCLTIAGKYKLKKNDRLNLRDSI